MFWGSAVWGQSIPYPLPSDLTWLVGDWEGSQPVKNLTPAVQGSFLEDLWITSLIWSNLWKNNVVELNGKQ